MKTSPIRMHSDSFGISPNIVLASTFAVGMSSGVIKAWPPGGSHTFLILRRLRTIRGILQKSLIKDRMHDAGPPTGSHGTRAARSRIQVLRGAFGSGSSAGLARRVTGSAFRGSRPKRQRGSRRSRRLGAGKGAGLDFDRRGLLLSERLGAWGPPGQRCGPGWPTHLLLLPASRQQKRDTGHRTGSGSCQCRRPGLTI